MTEAAAAVEAAEEGTIFPPADILTAEAADAIKAGCRE